MAVNIISPTEDLSHADWAPNSGLTVTVNTHAAPSTAGAGAGLADTLTDPNATQGSIFSIYEDIPNDATTWVMSLYVRKDADTSRFPQFFVQMVTGTTVLGGVQMNTSTGALADIPGAPPVTSGVVNVDANWWRVWWTKANNNTGNNAARVGIIPCATDSLGGSDVGSLTGSIIVWGVNMTNDATVQTYQPAPAYDTGIPIAALALAGTTSPLGFKIGLPSEA